jgi:hypothetical protein
MSDDSLGFEPIDDELRRRLGAAGPRPGDPEVALGALRPRYRRAKRRHQTVVVGGSVLAIAAIIGAGTAALSAGGPSSQNVRIPAANSSVPSRETTTTAPVNPALTTAPQQNGNTGTGGSTAGSGNGSGAAPATTAAPAAPSTKTYPSAGGSVTVKLENGALSIVSTKAASGYTEERHDTGPDRVEVRFTSDTTEWRIRVDLVNGEQVGQVTQN